MVFCFMLEDFMEELRQNDRRAIVLFTTGLFVLVTIFLLNIMLGAVSVSLTDVINSFFEPETVEKASRNIILKIRLPRAMAAIASGACLALSGLLLQVFFNNPIVEPYILGVSSGANLVLAIVLLGGYTFGMGTVSSMGLFLGAFLGAMLVMLIVIFASQKVKSVTSLLIIGLMMGYVCSAVTSVLTAFADKEKLSGFTVWTMGSFSGFTWQSVKILYLMTILFLIISFFMCKPLNALLLGESYAQSMGIAIKPFRLLIVLVASVLTAAVTAFAGPIAFIGLAVPHIVRLIFKTSNHQITLPATCILGGIMAGICDLGARLLFAPTELPISAITSLIGAPLVISMLVRKQGGEW